MKSLTVTLLQVSAGADAAVNRAALDALLAAAAPCDLLALPEVFALRGSDADYRRTAEPIPGPATDRLAGIARARRAWLLAGSLIEREGDAVYNTAVLFDRTGAITATYRKMHLFEATLDTGEVIRESDIYAAGDRPVLADVEGWRCGLSICYDLRFPELFRAYSRQDAHCLFVPANFTQRTGRDHWDILLRARAIENQCFVIAPAQCGANPATGIASYGHSLAVDPWGLVLAEAGGTEAAAVTVTLDPEVLDRIRRRIPVLRHRRL